MEIWILLLSILIHGWMSKNLSITWKQNIHLKEKREKIRERKMKQTTFPWLKFSEISGNVQTCWIELPWLHVWTRDVFWTEDAGLLLCFKWLTHENLPFNRTCPRKECWTHPCEHREATEQGVRPVVWLESVPEPPFWLWEPPLHLQKAHCILEWLPQ